jgi:glucose-6-phosphate dehydrogenase assembly protein OpcA
MSVEARNAQGGGAMGVAEIERELALLRMNEDGTAGARQSVLNLIVPTDEESAPEVTRVISTLASRYPSRAIVLITDPDEPEARLDVGLSAFCSVRGGTGGQVCAEVVTVHAEGPPACHPRSFAGPLLVPDLPTFLWYPDGRLPREAEGLVPLVDRVILDPGASGEPEDTLPAVARLLEAEHTPAIGDLQWTALTPWRALLVQLFDDAHEVVGRPDGIERVEILHDDSGASLYRSLLLVAWLSRALGWRPESSRQGDEGREISFSGPGGDVTVSLDPRATDASLSRVRLLAGDLTYEVDRHREGASVRATLSRDQEVLRESTVHLNTFEAGTLLGEELRLLGRDEVYEDALRAAVELVES